MKELKASYFHENIGIVLDSYEDVVWVTAGVILRSMPFIRFFTISLLYTKEKELM